MQALQVYIYDQLAADEIRLLRLRPGDSNVLEGELVTCRLLSEEPEVSPSPDIVFRTGKEVRLVASGDFDALTYCWSGGEPTTHITIYDEQNPEFVNGNIPLKPNLESALRTFRASLNPSWLQYFWIDALCINQGNKSEKSAQIQKMPAIYNQAKLVRIWLGKSTPQSDTAMDFIGELVELDDIDKLSTHVKTDHKWAAFRELMRREWFQRRWIIQEIAMARTPVVYCGTKTVPWETFTYAVSLFSSKAPQLKLLFKQSSNYAFHPDFLGEIDALGAKILVDLTHNLFRKQDNGEIVEHLLSLEALMSRLNMFQSSIPHDTIYSILWLANDATPRATRKAAALFPENTDTPHPSPPMPPKVLPPILQIDQLTSNGALDSRAISDSPTALQNTQDTQGEPLLLSTAANGSGPQQGSGVSTAKYLIPPDEDRRRRRSNSWALLRAEKDLRPELKPIEVDYDKDIFEVYRDFLDFVITRSRSLDILCRPWAPAPSNGLPDQMLPSWIPQSSGTTYALNPHTMVYQRVRADPLVGMPGTGIRPYNACGKQRALNSDSIKPFLIGRSLLTRGFVLDELDRITDKATHGSIPNSWLDLVRWQDHSLPLVDSFWRTLVADRDIDGISATPAHFPLACRWAFKSRTQTYDLNTDRLLHWGTCPELCFPFLRRLQAVVWDRKLSFTTGTKSPDGQETTHPLLALVPSAVQKGDLICILYGCSVPVVLRKREFASPPRHTTKRKVEPPRQRKKGTLKQNLKRPRLDILSSPDPGMGASALLGQGLQFASGPIHASRPAEVESSFWSGSSQTNESGLAPPFQHASPDMTSKPPVATTSSGPAVVEGPMGEQYEFIGECYVHGMMSGEAFKHREDTGNQVKEFWLV